jgi:signal transduction histidine kinase
MRLNLARKLSTIIVSVVALALVSSVSALLSTWHLDGVVQHTVDKCLPGLQIAAELQMLLCEPRGFLASYILDGGNHEWVDELRDKQRAFNAQLGRARRLAHTSEEKESLEKLESAYRSYDAKREEVIALFDKGDIEAAKKVLLKDVNDLYQQAYEQIQSHMMANTEHVGEHTADAQSQSRRATWLVGVFAVSTIGLGAVLLGILFRSVLFPLRRMMADARQFSGEGVATAGESQDELRVVGDYLRALMSDVADTRSNLVRSRHQLLQSEKLASVGKLAASVAHEIRNPLTAMKMWLFSIRKTVGHDPELDQSFDIVAEEMARLESIVRNFLEFSRPPALKSSPQYLSEVIGNTLDLFRHQIDEKQIILQYEGATGLPPVMADREQLKQVLINLLSNAVEATPEGGQICVRATLESDGSGGPMVVARVQDNGPGIPEEAQRRIFEPFFTTKEHGTGLGLCIAARIMGRHGGRLVLESSTQQGTSFAVWTPTARMENHDQDSRG